MPSDRTPQTLTGRRRFLTVAGATLGGSVATAGCASVRRLLDAPSLDWRTPFGSGRWVNSPLTLLDGRILATDDYSLAAFDAHTGERWWTAGLHFDHMLQGPVLADDTAVVAKFRRGAYRSDGTEVWTRDDEFEFNPFAAVDDRTVVGSVNAAERPRAIGTVDATNGDVLWTATPDDGANTSGNYLVSDAVAAGSGVVASASDEPLVGLSTDGSVQWTVDDDWDAHGPGRPTLAGGGDTVVAASGAVVGVDPTTGDRRWRHVLPGWASGVTVTDGTAYVTVDNQTPKVDSWDAAGGVLAYDVADGTERWRTQLPVGATPPAVDGQEVLVGTVEGTLNGLDAESGARRWNRSIGSRVNTAPLVGLSGRFVGVVDSDGSAAVAAVSR
ncbi:PQQ-binding-like beta-propeller repeat protein [Haloarchaeobius sp. HRN-SO-5]|uniref:outer membrane protein assembly factor BamB family protein n=1 Tax=Haloarchaeobius sp. HRN-SO-5 TaxID=3446118 RepID=UPI003EC112F9